MWTHVRLQSSDLKTIFLYLTTNMFSLSPLSGTWSLSGLNSGASSLPIKQAYLASNPRMNVTTFKVKVNFVTFFILQFKIFSSMSHSTANTQLYYCTPFQLLFYHSCHNNMFPGALFVSAAPHRALRWNST